jgi:hypothetical protein
MWRQLRYLSSPANVARLLDGTLASQRPNPWTPNETLAVRAYSISACIRQADQYFRAADEVELSTRPLLLFYGAECLAKAVILARRENVGIQHVNYHGLATRPSSAVEPLLAAKLNTYREQPPLWQIEEEFGVAQDAGVFPELCVALGAPAPTKGRVYFLREVLQVTPDLSDLYCRHYQTPSHCYSMYDEPRHDPKGHLVLKVYGQNRKGQDLLLAPDIAQDFSSDDTTSRIVQLRSNAPMAELPHHLKLIEGTVAGTYLMRTLDDCLAHSATILFVGLFIASNLVRYKPSFWTREIESDGSGAASMVEAFCNVAKRRFPNDVLDAIWCESFEYGTPARLG